MKNSINQIKSFLVDQKGAETAEWAVIVAILVTIAVAVYGTTAGGGLGVVIANALSKVSTAVSGV